MASTASSTPAPSRRAFFGTAIAAGTFSGIAVAPMIDGPLLDACASASRIWRGIDARAEAEDWSDDRIGEELDAYSVQLTTIITTPAHSREALIAKARLVEREFLHEGKEETQDRLLLRSLLHDITVAC